MGLKFRPGDAARQIVKPIEGVVQEAQVVGETIHYLVKWVTEDGHPTSKWFDEDQIEKKE